MSRALVHCNMGTHTDYRFPSETMLEKKYLRRKKHKRPDFIDWFLFLLIIVAVVLVGMTLEKFGVDPFMPEKVEASEVHDNAYYCNHLNSYQMSEESEIRTYCASLDITS